MRYIEKLKERGINAREFAQSLGKTRDWGYKIYSGTQLLQPQYYELLRAKYKFITETDLVRKSK